MPQSNRSYFALSMALMLAVLLISALSACSFSSSPDYIVSEARTLNRGDEIPALSGKKIVELSGGNLGNSALDADYSLLESLGTVVYDVNDPFESQIIEYEGVLLSTLFDQFGGASTTSVTFTANDDYQQDILIEDAEKWPIILATKVNGEYPPTDLRGPLMIVYPYDQYPELDPSRYDLFWIWQISNIKFN